MDEDGHITNSDERIVAEHVHASLLRERDRAWSTVSSTGQWLMASLLALNGAGVAFSVSRPEFGFMPAVMFAVGIVSAIGCGIFQWLAARLALVNLGNMINPAAIVDKRYLRPADQTMNDPVFRRAKCSIWLAVISLAALTIGGIASGVAFYSRDSVGTVPSKIPVPNGKTDQLPGTNPKATAPPQPHTAAAPG